jgi:excinuclease ABC subunit C
MNRETIKKLGLPESPGSYQFLDKAGKIIYIGKAVNLKNRVLSYWQAGANLTPAKQQLITKVERVKWITTDSEIEALLLEANLVKKHQPYYNVDLRDDKRFIYINVSLEDEVPGVFATRTLTKSGKYFGPFVSTQAVRETLKALRRIWPYCTQRKVGKTPCFYYQIGRCLGVCGGKISVTQYKRQVIKPIIEFLSGRKERVVKSYELRVARCERKQVKNKLTAGEAEILSQLKWQLLNIKQVLANARVLSVGEKYAADVVELAKVLGLPKVPQRIEGYDLSNIFGQEAVGSMVVFANGEPDKNEYRKFKISNFQFPISKQIPNPNFQTNSKFQILNSFKHGDVQMLEEVLTRRFNNDWPLPDLIVVDGGKAQLNTALKVLKKNKLDILAIAISKGLASEIPTEGWGASRISRAMANEIPTEGWGASRISRARSLRSAGAPDKIFFPNQASALQLPLNSPALHLIKRVRDEAHRFAIGYHRKLRSKRFLGK